MATGTRHGRAAGGASARYTAAVCGDGRVLPIVERLGRRQVREIDPLSSRGRELLASGSVTLLYDGGERAEALAIDALLERLCERARGRRDAYPGLAQWTTHHDGVLRSLARMRRRLKSGH